MWRQKVIKVVYNTVPDFFSPGTLNQSLPLSCGRSCLNAAQDDLSSVLEEKRKLLELVQSLQASTNSSDKLQANSKR